MDHSTRHTTRRGGAARTIAMAFAFATLLTGISPSIARAEDDHRDHRQQEERRAEEQRRHERERHGWVYEHPQRYYVAPPPVIYAPPPPPPAFEFVFPLHIR